MQIKLASVKLAMKYMRRVSAELEAVGGGPEEKELIVQGVRFAFRVHQVNNSHSFLQLGTKHSFNFLLIQLCICLSLLEDSMSKQWGLSRSWETKSARAMFNAKTKNKNLFAGLHLAKLISDSRLSFRIRNPNPSFHCKEREKNINVCEYNAWCYVHQQIQLIQLHNLCKVSP